MGFPQRYDAARCRAPLAGYLGERAHLRIRPGRPAATLRESDTPPQTVSGIYSYRPCVFVYPGRGDGALLANARPQRFTILSGFDDNGCRPSASSRSCAVFAARDLSRPEFIATCLQVSREFEDRFEIFWRGLGMSVDWRLRYSTSRPSGTANLAVVVSSICIAKG